MKTKKKVAPKRERDSHKKVLADLAYWKSVEDVLNRLSKTEPFSYFVVSGWTYRDTARFNRIIETYQEDGVVVKTFYGNSFDIPGFLGNMILEFGKYYDSCVKIEDIISQFGW